MLGGGSDLPDGGVGFLRARLEVVGGALSVALLTGALIGQMSHGKGPPFPYHRQRRSRLSGTEVRGSKRVARNNAVTPVVSP